MAAIFSIRRNDPPDDKISISDTGTGVLLTVLILAGSALAETDSQRRMVVWLSERAAETGSEHAGFSISEMPWDPATFEADKHFLVRTTDAASQKTGWQTLNFWPNARALMPMLGWFRKSFVRFRATDIEPDALTHWLAEMEPDDPVLNGFPRCKKHRAFLTWKGCAVCSNAR
jgi:hypothetical protein